jgi:hypothetical protein
MPAPLPPCPAGHYLTNTARSNLVLEFYCDFCCPFSKKMWERLCLPGGVISTCEAQSVGDIQFIMHQVPQPWHPQSSYMHEASFAARNVDADKWHDFSTALFAKQSSMFDSNVVDLTRRQCYEALTAISVSVGYDGPAFMEQLNISPATEDASNAGNKTTQQMKWAVKLHRMRSVHVTPTVFANGIEAGQIGSGWSQNEWMEFLKPYLKPYLTAV